MRVMQLVAAVALKAGRPNGSMRALTWTELGDYFGLTKDAVRNRVNRFKEKFNIVDTDTFEAGWNRDFLRSHTPDSEKYDQQWLASANIFAGDVFSERGVTHIRVPDQTGAHDEAYNTVFIRDDKVQRGFIPNSYELRAADRIIEKPLDKLASAEKAIRANIVAKIEPLKFLITPSVLIVVRDGQPLSIDKSHKNFVRIQTALEAGKWQEVLDFIDLKNSLTKFSNGRVVVEDGKVTLDGEPVNGKLVNRLINLLIDENSEALQSLTNFLEKTDENPDFRVVTRIYDFMAHNDLRTDAEGYILAYKVVQFNYLDKYTSTMDNSPGKLVQMKRNKVNPKDTETCSHGLHIAARDYIHVYGKPSLSPEGDRVLLCRIHPKDFVSIPTDYNDMKARVCEYLVLKDVTELFVKGNLEDEGQEV